MNFLRRWFSFGDFQGELKDCDENINVLNFKKGFFFSVLSLFFWFISVLGMIYFGVSKFFYNKD